MSAHVVVDPVGETIRVDARVWPFVWDPSAAAITVELSDHSYTLNEITWRQKRNLARARERAGLPLRRALVRACLREPRSLPADPIENEALASLAEWLVATGRELPWEPAILARAMLDVCRAASLTPAEVDELPASDVEELWLAVRGEPLRAVPASAEGGHEVAIPARGFKKIVVVPDPDEEAPLEPSRMEAAASNEAPTVVGTPEVEPNVAPVESVDVESGSAPDRTPAARRAHTRPAVRAVPSVVRRTARSVRAHTPNAPRFRLTRADVNAVDGAPIPPPASTAPAEPMSAALRAPGTSRGLTLEPRRLAHDQPERASTNATTTTSTRVRSVDRVPMIEFLADRVPSRGVADEWRQQFEDELSRAAVEAGLDPES
jgi:hypothetical protein